MSTPIRSEFTSQQTTPSSEKVWDAFAPDYEKKVYSLTRIPEKRDRILQQLCPHDHVLIVGCGSMTYLQRAMLSKYPSLQITAADFNCRMLEIASADFTHPRLRYKKYDTRDIDCLPGSFDVVISTNSILPEIRIEVLSMYTSIYRSLRSGGRFLAYLPSYTCSEHIAETYPQHQKNLDPEQWRIADTSGWQCFHTRETIRNELGVVGFKDIRLEIVGIENAAERSQLESIYGEIGQRFWEFFIRTYRPMGLSPRIAISERAPQSTILSYNSEQLNEDQVLVRAISDFYRYVFNNQNGHYLVFPGTGKFIPPQEVFGRDQEEYVDLSTMDALTALPIDPHTREQAIFWHDPDITTARLQAKFSKDCYLALIKDEEGGICGVTFGYFAPIAEIFELEGWRNPFYYAGIERSDQYRDVLRSLPLLAQFLGVTEINPDEVFFCYNCVALHPNWRTSDKFRLMTTKFLQAIPVTKRQTQTLSEILFPSKSYCVYTSHGMKPVPGILNASGEPQPGDNLLAVSSVADLLASFSGESRYDAFTNDLT